MRRASTPLAARLGAPSRVPLYRRTLTWDMRPDMTVARRPNNVLERRFVAIGDGQP